MTLQERIDATITEQWQDAQMQQLLQDCRAEIARLELDLIRALDIINGISVEARDKELNALTPPERKEPK